MPSFILRQLDPDFWARVQAKATAEGTTVKAVILRLLQQWLGPALVACAVLLAGCSEMQTSPVAPSATAPPGPSSTAPTSSAPRFTVTLEGNGGVAYLNEPWSTTLAVDSSAGVTVLPASVSYRCGGGPDQFITPFVGLRIVSCTFQAAGSYPVSAIVVAPNTVTTTGGTTVTAMARPVPPPPPPPPPPTTPVRRLSLDVKCIANVGGSTPCNVAGTLDGQVVTSQLHDVHWDLGNGDTTVTSGPTITYTYKQPGTYLVIAEATVDGVTGSGRTTVDAK